MRLLPPLLLPNKHTVPESLFSSATGSPQGEPVFAVMPPDTEPFCTSQEVTIRSGTLPIVLSVWLRKKEATTVVFYPGSMASALQYQMLLENLVGQGFNVVGLHPLSHGHSPIVQKNFTFTDILQNGQDAVAFAQAHFSGPVVIAGHSQGGILTLAHAALRPKPAPLAAAFALGTLLPQHPRAIELTIFAPFARWRAGLLRGLQRAARWLPRLPVCIPMYLSLRKIFHGGKEATRPPGHLRGSYPLAFIASLFATNLAQATREGGISCPLMVISARNDALFTPDLMECMLACIEAPDKSLIFLEGGGHMAPMVPRHAAEIAAHMAHKCAALGLPLYPSLPLYSPLPLYPPSPSAKRRA